MAIRGLGRFDDPALLIMAVFSLESFGLSVLWSLDRSSFGRSLVRWGLDLGPFFLPVHGSGFFGIFLAMLEARDQQGRGIERCRTL
jgi:hypothetical protein